MRCKLSEAPDEPDPGSDKATQLPSFQRPTWVDLREAWRRSEYTGKGPMKLEQRLVLDAVHTRRALRRIDKLARTAERELKEKHHVESFELMQIRTIVQALNSD